MEMPASLSLWRSMAQSTQVCTEEVKNDNFNSSKSVDLYVTMSPVVLQEPCLPTSLLGPRGLLCRLPLPQLPPLEPALALASLHPRLRPSAPHPPPPQRALARLSQPPAGLPNSSCPLYVLPRPLFRRETPHEYTIQ